jgi:DNA repair exonuclease SbcCD ATPase subunit
MAEDRISSLIDLQNVNKEIETTKAGLNEIIALMAKVASGISGAGGKTGDAEGLKNLSAAYKDLQLKIQEAEQKLKAYEGTTTELGALQKRQIEITTQLSAQKKAYKDQIVAETSAYKALSNEYAKSLQHSKDLAAQYGVQSKQAKEAAAQTLVLNNKLKEIDSSLGNHQRNVGNYQSALDGMKTGWLKVVGVLGTAAAAWGVVTGALEIYKKIAATSETATDKLKEMIKGAEFATSEFFATIRTGDWSNLLDNLKKAYEIGK